jgi:hypothetical protein
MYWSIRNEGFRGPAAALLGQIDIALHDLEQDEMGCRFINILILQGIK